MPFWALFIPVSTPYDLWNSSNIEPTIEKYLTFKRYFGLFCQRRLLKTRVRLLSEYETFSESETLSEVSNRIHFSILGSVVDTSSICDIECDGTVDFSDQGIYNSERGADQYAKIHKSYEYTLSSNVFQSRGGGILGQAETFNARRRNFGPSLQSSESKFLINFDSKPGF